MAISYGQWLFWIWIGGIGLSLFKCADWQCARTKPHHWHSWNYWYWVQVTVVGALLVERSSMRIGKISPDLRLGLDDE